jgi:hypothetical protein
MCVCVYGILRNISFKSVSNKFRTVKSRAGMILKSTLILVNNFPCDSFVTQDSTCSQVWLHHVALSQMEEMAEV